MSATLTVRDRPWSFWGGAVLLFFGVVMFVITLVIGDRNVRSRETSEIVRYVAMAFAAFGAIGCWRGRAAIFEPSTKQLLRGGDVVRDLANAKGLIIYPLGGRSKAHYVVLAQGDSEMQPGDTIDAVRGEGNFLYPLAEGVPPGMARHAALRWRDALHVPIVVLPGCDVDLSD